MKTLKEILIVIFVQFPIQVFVRGIKVHAYLIEKIRPRFKFAWTNTVFEDISNQIAQVDHISPLHGSTKIKISIPNATCFGRYETFSIKEPDTLWWIDKFGHEGAFCDIGANIGLYSLYFAKLYQSKVYAFEPSALNLTPLVTNINLNGKSEKIEVFPIALTDENSVADFTMSNNSVGGALSSFGVDFGWNGMPLKSTFRYKTIGMSLDQVWKLGLITEVPALIKLDVDGIEHLILGGAKVFLSNPNCRHILLEMNKDFKINYEICTSLLLQYGFHDITFMAPKSPSSNRIWRKI